MAASILDISLRQGVECTEAEDLRLAASLRAGDEWAYEELLRRFQQPVYALALRLLNDPSDAADAVQEVFLKVFRNVGAFRGQSSLKTWVYRIAVNEAHNSRRWFLRHRRREADADMGPEETRDWTETIPDGRRSPFDVALDHERHRMIEAALERMNPIFREAVVLRDIADMRYEEIAEVLGVTMGTVKSRILRGREALRQELAGSLKDRPVLRLAPRTAE